MTKISAEPYTLSTKSNTLGIENASASASRKMDPGNAIELDDTQQKICHDILSENFFVGCVVGGAGTGKTFVVKRVVQFAKKKGMNFIILAPTGRAAANTNTGMTIARFLNSRNFIKKANQARGEPWAEKCISELAPASKWAIDISPGSQGIVIIDEGFMMTLRTWVQVTNAFSCCTTKGGIKFVIVGDYNQLPPVGGKPFYTDPRFLKWGQKGQLQFFELQRSYRCGGDPVLETLLNGFKNDENKSSVDAIIDDLIWKSMQVKLKTPKLIITQRNKTVNDINRMKSDRAATGKRFVLLHLGSNPNEKPFKYSQGEPIVITQNEYGLVPSEAPFDKDEGIFEQVYRQDLVKINGQFGTITNIVATVEDDGTPSPIEGDMQAFDVALDTGVTVTIFMYKKKGKFFADVCHGYASTLYKVQGLGFDVGQRIEFDTCGMSSREVMTAFSRVRCIDDLYLDYKRRDGDIHGRVQPIEKDANLEAFLQLMRGEYIFPSRKRAVDASDVPSRFGVPRKKRQVPALRTSVFGAGNLKL